MQRNGAVPGAQTDGADLLRRLQEAVADERAELLFAFVGSQIRRVLRLDDDVTLETANRLLDLGLDSLMALELRRLLAAGIGAAEDALSATLVFDYPTIGALVDHLESQLVGQAEAVETGASPAHLVTVSAATPAQAEQSQTNVADLTDEEVEALLLEKLSRLG